MHCRPRDHLVALSKRYAEAWRQSDEFRADMGTWPAWCFLPIAGWYAIVCAAAGVQRLDMRHAALIGDVARLAALGSWRVTQGVYRFDPALYDALISTPVDGELPCDVLYRLPEWCVYCETPGLMWLGESLHGVFAHLEHDANDGRAELRLLLDGDKGLTPLPVHLGQWSLSEAISRVEREAKRQAGAAGAAFPANDKAIAEIAGALQPILSLLLYLCSQAAEIGDGSRRPANPVPVRTKRGPRLFAPDQPATWDVGVRMGAALRAAYHARETTGDTQHAGPVPHVRRAHWHGYWTGPKLDADKRKLALRWMPPIPVNLTEWDQLQTVIRPVRESKS